MKKKLFELQECFLKSLEDKLKPLLASVLCDGEFCIGCSSTFQYHVSCQYCNPVEITLLEMVHKDHMWINMAMDIMFPTWFTLTDLMIALYPVLIVYLATYLQKFHTEVVALFLNCQKWMICHNNPQHFNIWQHFIQ